MFIFELVRIVEIGIIKGREKGRGRVGEVSICNMIIPNLTVRIAYALAVFNRLLP